MQKIWQWIRDRKTNTIRKWRSSMVRNNTTESLYEKRNGKMAQHSSAISLPSNSHTPIAEYDDVFEEPEIKRLLEVRRQSLRESRSSDSFPVPPPDVEDTYPNPYLERLTPQSTPKSTERKSNQRSPRQIRFQIPEVRVSFEEEEPQRIEFEDRRSPMPPPEFEWSPVTTMSDNQRGNRPPNEAQSSTSFDLPFETKITTPRRNSANERARQNLMAQRRQSNVQFVQSITGRRTSTTIIPLTAAQIHLVRSLWRQMYTTKGPTVIGASIYHRLCFKNQTVKDQMKRVSLPIKFQNQDSFVKAHSKAIAELIDQVVENLDNLDSMTDELVRIGKIHARVLRGELTGKLWNAVAETFIDCTLEWGDKRCRSETVRKAWALIVAFVIEKIKLGHHEQRKQMLATRQSLPSIELSLSDMRI